MTATLQSITGLGLVTCIGRDVVTAAAAQRAGIVRRQPVADFAVLDDEGMEGSLVGAPISGFEGFVQTGAWIRMGQAALADLIRYGNLPSPQQNPGFWKETSLSWIVPEVEFDRFGWPEDQVPALLHRWAGGALADVLGIKLSHAQTFFANGPAGLAAAVQGRPEGLKRVILLAVDSLLDSMSLAWLNGQNRLKTDDNQIGICPGQGAACALLELPDAAVQRGATAEATILSATEQLAAPADSGDEDPETRRLSAAPVIGRAITTAIAEALQLAQRPLPFRGDVYLDLNGEVWKAMAWGHAQVALGPTVDFTVSRIHFPIIETGDIGAANGLASLCFAVRSFVRGYATGDDAIICSISDSGRVGAVVVGRPT